MGHWCSVGCKWMNNRVVMLDLSATIFVYPHQIWSDENLRIKRIATDLISFGWANRNAFTTLNHWTVENIVCFAACRLNRVPGEYWYPDCGFQSSTGGSVRRSVQWHCTDQGECTRMELHTLKFRGTSFRWLPREAHHCSQVDCKWFHCSKQVKHERETDEVISLLTNFFLPFKRRFLKENCRLFTGTSSLNPNNSVLL